MSWVALDDQFGRNRKTALVKSKGAKGLAALGALTLLWSWCGANEPEGFIPQYLPAQEIGAQWRVYLAILEGAGFIHRGDRGGEPGWWIHDFQLMNPEGRTASAAREAAQARRSAAGKAGAAARWGKQDSRSTDSTDSKTDIASCDRNAIAMAPYPYPLSPPLPPAQRGASHDGTHQNCRACGTTRRQEAQAAKKWRPAWCGRCDERTRLIGYDGPSPVRCPDCHPKLVKGLADEPESA